ncbi:hypothetical protein Ddye_019344 [Dipteronia dyeriana]|uniref:Helicase-like transcription factor CHR28 n=1 Tax=Dipteronia dyeriana TaxID=168575 RepID=A0AAD9TYQ8_9ROSI|nr:hypothetical protein Ddye_019344 [Dipteronia dyeriana]
MLMAENSWGREDFSSVNEFVAGDEGVEGGDDLSIDMETLFHILDEKKEEHNDLQQSSPTDDPSLIDLTQDKSSLDVRDHNNLQLQSGSQVDLMDPGTSHPSYSLEASDAGRGVSGDYNINLEPTELLCFPAQACSASLKDWFPTPSVTYCSEGVGVNPFETPGCSTASSFSEGDGNQVLDNSKNMNFDLMEGKTGIHFGNLGSQIDSEYASHGLGMENLDVKRGHYGPSNENRLGSLGALEPNSYTFIDRSFMDADVSSHNVTSTDSTICQSSEVVSDLDDHYPAMLFMNRGDSLFDVHSPFDFPSSFDFQYVPSNEEITTNKRDEEGEFLTESACSNSRMVLNSQGENLSISERSLIDYFDVKGQNFKCEDSKKDSAICRNSQSDIGTGIFDDKMSIRPVHHSHSYLSSTKHSFCIKDEGNDKLAFSRSMVGSSVELIDESAGRQSSNGYGGNVFPDEDAKKLFTDISPSLSNQKHVLLAKEEKEDMIIEYKRARHCQDNMDRISSGSHMDGRHLNLNLNVSGRYLPCAQPASSKKQLGCIKDEMEVELIKPRSWGSHILNRGPESIQSNSSNCRSYVDDDPDICILEDISQPARPNQSLEHGNTFYMSQSALSNQSLVSGNTVFTPQSSSCSNSLAYSGVSHSAVGGTRHKAHDEQLIYRVAMQDLSQPRSEASPPDGLLAVPLLRHQRIALSWMVQKETSSLHCSGGILADDQGLGKTVSTIALILKERPPSFRMENVSKCELETLNLDDDDDDDDDDSDGVDDLDRVKRESGFCQVKSAKSLNSVAQAKGRPAAGTLVVCPTSVLRQWAEELRTKVTSKGSLSVLVYHGSNRTKDHLQLAKYDVVITTYSIVSMEVPKQPLVDKEEDDQIVKTEGDDTPPRYCSSGLKRKYPLGSKQKKGADGKLLEIVSGPLAKVGWFRVVLDEAQSIKNHRTQVARACWGLRAKRRWCLSGTPIQNAIDDLYSYFRFLRYDPYAVYKSFCSKIKVPITKSPSKGYKKLQAVLKTIMLRRTKGTLLDGQPIINLPPKVIELKKVEFSDEERKFYSQLEIDSRDQFQVWFYCEYFFRYWYSRFSFYSLGIEFLHAVSMFSCLWKLFESVNQEYAAAGTVEQNYVNILLMLLRLRQACDHPLLVNGFDSNSLWKSSVQMAKKLPLERKMCLLNLLEASLAICSICNDPPEDAVVSICGHVFCDQCISEHLTGDDHQCPATNCKIRLNVSSVFSKATLNESLSEQPGQDSSSKSCDSEIVEAEEPSSCLGYDSSKIKAALEVLQSLAKPKENPSKNNSLQNFDGRMSCPNDSKDLQSEDSLNTEKNSVAETCLNDSVKVVGEKAIVFSQWTKMLDLLEACLKDSSIQYRRLDGTMSVVARDKAVKDFNTLPEVSVMIMSLKAASLGLNMVAASRVLLLDLWWNPTTEDQAIDRAHRIGQTRPVSVLRLTVKDTVEDRILALQQKKREMVASAFGEDENGGRQTRLTMDDLKYLFMA